MMTTLFDYLNSINHNKKDLMTGTENDDLAEKGYPPYQINKGLSYFSDTIEQANIMNGCWQLDKKLQYLYLINTIRPKKRFAKWIKKQDNDDLDAVAEYYGYSYEKAKAVLKLHSPDQIIDIKKRLEKG